MGREAGRGVSMAVSGGVCARLWAGAAKKGALGQQREAGPLPDLPLLGVLAGVCVCAVSWFAS